MIVYKLFILPGVITSEEYFFNHFKLKKVLSFKPWTFSFRL